MEDHSVLALLLAVEVIDAPEASIPPDILPDHLLLVALDQTHLKRAVIDSWSPFIALAARQRARGVLGTDEVIYGYRFSATVQLRTPLHALQQHGRIERRERPLLPQIAEEPWQGTWVAKTRPDTAGQMASDIGPIDADGGDYLRFLLLCRRIMACPLSDTDKANLVHRSANFYGAGGHAFGQFIEHHGGPDALLRKLNR
ncbi:TPA: hypothetical protein ACL1SD_005472 [Pseudomonas aeruginosa]